MATGIYDVAEKSYTTRKPHTFQCKYSKPTKYLISNSYEIQKSFILEELKRNPTLTPSPALNLLTKKNSTLPDEEKWITLTYDQAKYIIQCYKEENGIKDAEPLTNLNILTQDNSLFLRFNSSFYTVQNGNFYLLFL